ncbi:hypothetical protein KDV41_21560, partial [Providencia stuartii]|uniref:hypothetical protein n=1 Tax=Providencia stuartii TaxID=588 RepID=UPI00332E875A
FRLEEQSEVVAEATERQEEFEARAEAAEIEVDELKSQLADYQAANDHLNLVQTALRQQEKIDRYQADIEELTFRLEEQSE